MNAKVLDVLMNIIHYEDLPITVEVGSKIHDENGNTSVNVLLEYDFKDSSLVNENICRAINLTFDLTD